MGISTLFSLVFRLTRRGRSLSETLRHRVDVFLCLSGFVFKFLNISALAPLRAKMELALRFYVPSAIELTGTTGADRLRMSRCLLLE